MDNAATVVVVVALEMSIKGGTLPHIGVDSPAMVGVPVIRGANHIESGIHIVDTVSDTSEIGAAFVHYATDGGTTIANIEIVVVSGTDHSVPNDSVG